MRETGPAEKTVTITVVARNPVAEGLTRGFCAALFFPVLVIIALATVPVLNWVMKSVGPGLTILGSIAGIVFIWRNRTRKAPHAVARRR